MQSLVGTVCREWGLPMRVRASKPAGRKRKVPGSLSWKEGHSSEGTLSEHRDLLEMCCHLTLQRASSYLLLRNFWHISKHKIKLSSLRILMNVPACVLGFYKTGMFSTSLMLIHAEAREEVCPLLPVRWPAGLEGPPRQSHVLGGHEGQKLLASLSWARWEHLHLWHFPHQVVQGNNACMWFRSCSLHCFGIHLSTRPLGIQGKIEIFLPSMFAKQNVKSFRYSLF